MQFICGDGELKKDWCTWLKAQPRHTTTFGGEKFASNPIFSNLIGNLSKVQSQLKMKDL